MAIPIKSDRCNLPDFKTEFYLVQAIAGLLERIDGTTDIQILHGSQEYGKDIVFKTRDALGEPITCACVVKNNQITGKVGSPTGARTVLQQVQQAFDTPYLDGFGEETRIARVYIMTPFRVNQTSVRSIQGSLRNFAGAIVIISGEKLFSLFRRYWPDFIAEERSEINELLSATARELSFDDNLDRVVNLYRDFHPKKRDTKKIYVDPLFHIEMSWIDIRKVILKYLPDPDFLIIPGRESKGPDDPGTSPKPIKGPERENRILNLKKDLNRLRSLLEHINKWDWIKDSGLQSSNLLNVFELFSSSLIAALQGRPLPINGENPLKYEGSLVRVDWKKLREIGEVITKGIQSLIDQLDLLKRSKMTIGDPFSFQSAELITSYGFQSSQECLNTMRLPQTEYILCNKANIGKDLFSSIDEHLLIVAPAGYGKTSFCRWQVLLDVERYRAGNSKILPIYIPLHRVHSTRIDTFEDVLSKTPVSAFVRESDWESVYEGRICLRVYLDGLDEIPREEERIKVIELARGGITKYPKSQLVMTARNMVHGPWLSWLVRVSLSGLDSEQQLLLALKWFDNDTEKVQAFNKQFKRNSALHPIMSVPLLATLTILVYMRTGRLPPSKSELYKTFVDLMCGGWDLAKGVLRDSRFGRSAKTMVLCRLAGLAHTKSIRFFSQDLLGEAISLVLSKSITNQENTRLTQELLEDGIIVEAGDGYQFAHLSFQEFLAAKDLISDIKNLRVRDIFRNYLNGDDWWREVIGFYIGLSENPRETAKLVMDLPGTLNGYRLCEVLLSINEQFPECGIKEMYSHFIENDLR